MGGVPSTVTNKSIYRIPVPAKISCVVPEKNMAEAVRRDMASSGCLKLAALCLFCAQSVSKNKSVCDCSGARPQSDRSTLLCNSLLLLYILLYLRLLYHSGVRVRLKHIVTRNSAFCCYCCCGVQIVPAP